MLRNKVIIFFLTIALAFFSAKAVLAVDDDILCPASGTAPTEILVYYHGLYLSCAGKSSSYCYSDAASSLKAFKMEYNKIKSARAGVVGVHVNSSKPCNKGSNCDYPNSISKIMQEVNTKCGISNASSLSLTTAGHSNGGYPAATVGSPQKRIILDGIYWDPGFLGNSCSKLRIIMGGSTKAKTLPLIQKCSSDPNFKYIDNGEAAGSVSMDKHYNTMSSLATFYLDSEAPTSTSTPTTTPRERKPIELINPLENLQVEIPGLKDLMKTSTATCETSTDQTICKLPWLSIYIKALFNYAIGIIGILAALAMMIGGVIRLIAAGNASRISESKAWMGASITGMLIGLTSFILLNEINPDLVGLKSIEIGIVEEIYPDVTTPVESSSIDLQNASLDPSTWKPIPSDPNICANSYQANQPIIDKLLAATSCMKNNNLKIELVSGARPIQSQKAIYDERYTHDPDKCGTLKAGYAPACCPYPLGVKICPHTSASAFDLRAVKKCGVKEKKLSQQYILQDCMQQVGAYLLDSECWHFEYPQISKNGSKSVVGNHNKNYCGDWPP